MVNTQLSMPPAPARTDHAATTKGTTMNATRNHRPSAAWTAWHILHNTYNAMTVSHDVAAANVNGIAVTITRNTGVGLDVHVIHANGDTYGYSPQGDDAQAIATDAIGFVNRHAYPDTTTADDYYTAENHQRDTIAAMSGQSPRDYYANATDD